MHHSASSLCGRHSKALSLFFFFFVFLFLGLLVIVSAQKLRALVACSPSLQTCPSPQLREARPHGTLGKSPGGLPPHHHHHQHGPAGDAPHVDDKHQGSGRPTTGSSRKRGGHHRAQRKTSHSPGHSTDSAHSQHNLPNKGKSAHQKK